MITNASTAIAILSQPSDLSNPVTFQPSSEPPPDLLPTFPPDLAMFLCAFGFGGFLTAPTQHHVSWTVAAKIRTILERLEFQLDSIEQIPVAAVVNSNFMSLDLWSLKGTFSQENTNIPCSAATMLVSSNKNSSLNESPSSPLSLSPLHHA